MHDTLLIDLAFVGKILFSVFHKIREFDLLLSISVIIVDRLAISIRCVKPVFH